MSGNTLALQDSPRMQAFWQFARARHDVFEKRLRGDDPPWTSDPVIANYRFTNVFRAADRVSQFLISDVQYDDGWAIRTWLEHMFRTTLFRLFNQPATWIAIKQALGEEPSTINWDWQRYTDIVTKLTQDPKRKDGVFNAAYILPPGDSVWGYSQKHANLLKTLDYMMSKTTFAKIFHARTLADVFFILRDVPLLGNFLAFQLTIDLNYSQAIDFDEDDFVVPGPGALRGFSKLMGRECNETVVLHVIKTLTERQDEYCRVYGLEPIRLLGVRKPHLIDVQNLGCEFSKWTKVAHPEWGEGIDFSTTPKIKQKWSPERAKAPIQYRFPEKPGWPK